MNIEEYAELQITNRTNWLHQAEQADRKLGDLPEAFLKLEGSADCGYDGILYLYLSGGNETMQVCLDAGAEFNKPEVSTYSGKFKAKGHLGKVLIDIIDLPIPPQCHVEKEAYTAYRYKAICNEEDK